MTSLGSNGVNAEATTEVLEPYKFLFWLVIVGLFPADFLTGSMHSKWDEESSFFPIEIRMFDSWLLQRSLELEDLSF
jgi:hypothetical protein